MKTRIQKLLVCAALVGAATLAQAQFDYTNNGNGTCTITGYYGDDGALSIPDSLDGLIVVSIGEGAFSIAYGNSGGELTSVTIPNTVTSIGNYAFEGCTSLTSVTIPGSVSGIGGGAFWACTNLTSVIMGNGVTNIGNYAFYYCARLTSVTIPASATNIGVGAFVLCSNLTAITVDAANSFHSSVNGVLFDKSQTTLLEFPGGRAGSYTIPASVTSIGDEAFYACSLTSVTIGNGVTSIGNFAFGECTSLTSVTIPASVTSIGDGAFEVCTSLTSVTIPASVTSIGYDAFFDCGLTNVIIGNGVTNIGNYAFYDCFRLTSVTIPNSVTSIGSRAFYYCSRLTSVTIPASVTNIGEEAFSDCPSLGSVTIPASVTSIGSDAFGYCTSLTAAYFLGNAPSNPGHVFDGDPVIVYYLSGATGWGPVFGGRQTELWNPQASALRVTGGHFGFNITGPSNTVIVVEACTNLAQPVWLPVSTNALNDSGASSFSDPHSANYPARFYRFRSP